MTEAYEVLSDEEKRRLYDQYGEEGLKERGGFGDYSDLFSQFFFFGGGRPSGPKKTKDMMDYLECTLEELYNGAKKKKEYQRTVLCKDCKGTGSKDGKKLPECSQCRGEGITIQLRQHGPSTFEQVRMVCPKCEGDGLEKSSKDSLCKSCKGKRMTKQLQVIEVEIDKGMTNDTQIRYTGMSNEAPDCITGDFIVVLKEVPHPVFKRGRNPYDLFVEKEIYLTDALCGFEFTIEHLDGRVLHIVSQDVIKPFDVKEIREEGMPMKGRIWDKGSLFVHFNVIFPDKLTDEQVQTIRSLELPKSPSVTKKDDFVEVAMYDVDENAPEDAHDDSDDEHHGGGVPSCVQQ